MKKYLVLMVILTMALGCATPQTKTEEGTRKGAAIGAIGGAVLGQIIGGDTKATLIGAGIGALAGGAIGRSYGKKADEQEAALRRQLAAIEEANVQRNADVLAVTFMSDMLFDIGSATLKPGSKEQIRRVSSVLTKYTDTAILIAGHTDSTGSAALNQQLSELRAKNVKLAIVEQGVHPGRIKTVGFGASAPIADNSTEEGRRLNRRVVITISEGKA
ncbi:MAG: OmpA family protein [Planctomycetota bacterium]|jgi:outer membrane protein OmpA-like peptidoglycan-associated protein